MWATEWKTQFEEVKPEEKIAEFKKGVKEFQKYFKTILGTYDKAVVTCRNDDKFSLTDFMDKFIDFSVDFDVQIINGKHTMKMKWFSVLSLIWKKIAR